MTDIVFYSNFSKKENSTKRPNETQGVTIPCVLKNGTTFQSPSFIVCHEPGSFLNYNYCKWSNHYYYINTSTILSNNQIEVTCTEDALATYRGQIGDYTCFIERSSMQNHYYNDALWIPTDKWVQESRIIQAPKSVFVPVYSGNFIVRTIGVTGISIYYMSQEELNSLLSFMWSDGSWGDVLNDAWTKLFFDPFKYILSIDWTPVVLEQFFHLTDTVKLGFWDSKVLTNLIGGDNAPTASFSYDVSLTNKSYADTEFRYWSNDYSRYFVKLPLVGIIPVDITKTNKGQLIANYYYDVISGIADIWLKSGTQDIGHYQAQLSVPVQIGYATTNPTNLINGMIGTSASVVTGDIVSTISKGLATAQSGTAPEPSIIGQVGNINGILNNLDAGQYTYVRDSLLPDVTTEGYADGHTRQIKSLSGYIKCRHASIDISGFDGDQNTVNDYLNNGFYYE